MEATIVISILTLVAVAIGVVLYPLWQRQSAPSGLDQGLDRSQAELHARYQALLAAMHDLMFDYEMGKVAADDYETLLDRHKADAAAVRRQIDLAAQGQPVTLEADLDARLEAMIAQFRNGDRPQAGAVQADVEAELEALAQLVPATAATAGQCSSCGKALQPGDAFCSGCGQPAPQAEAPTGCPDCGYATQPDDAFCASCGTRLSQSSPTLEDVQP